MSKIFASNHIYQQRLTTCRSCEEYGQTLKICKACGCFMPAKAKIAKAPRKDENSKRKSGEAWGASIQLQKQSQKKPKPDKTEITQLHPTRYGGGCLVMWGPKQCNNKAAKGSHLCEHHTNRLTELKSKSTSFNGFFLDVGGRIGPQQHGKVYRS